MLPSFRTVSRSRSGVAAEDREQPTGLDLARSGTGDDALESLSTQLAEVDERLELAAGTLVELAQGPGELGMAQDRDGQDVGLDVPG